MLDASFFVIQALNGLQLAALLFLLSVGLSVVFGLMNFINLAHGTLYMLGAYFALSVSTWTGSFWLALLLAPLGVALVAALLYYTLLARMQSAGPMRQVLVTFALIFVGFDLVRLGWGRLTETLPPPDLLSSSVQVFGETYPSYRLFVIALGVAMFVLLYLGLERTRLGAIVRAGVDDREMVAAMGIDIDRALFIVFCVGCWLAGLAGVVAAPLFSLEPGMDVPVLILALIVVVVGGPGSLVGAGIGALLIGMADTFGQVLLPTYASVLIYALMALVLILRPGGLVPVRGAHGG